MFVTRYDVLLSLRGSRVLLEQTHGAIINIINNIVHLQISICTCQCQLFLLNLSLSGECIG